VDVELFLAFIPGAGKELKILACAAAIHLISPRLDFRQYYGNALSAPINDVTVLHWQSL